MREKLLNLKNSIDTSKKIKKSIGIVAFFIVVLFSGIYLVSYSHYFKDSSNLVMEGIVKFEDGDVILKVFLQNRDSSGNPTTGYSESSFIPQNEYTYASAKTKCTDGVSIKSFTNNKFSILASNVGTCEVYFDANSSEIINDEPDVILKLMVEQTKGSGDYKEVNVLPSSNNYVVNKAMTSSACSNATIEGRKINVDLTSNTECTIYADIELTPTLATYLMNVVYNSDTNQQNIGNGASGLYFHNADLTNGAADNTYRYAGYSNLVDNYVCFQGDTCTEDNLYRIISVDSETSLTKVIKATSVGEMIWNSSGDASWDNSSVKAFLNGDYLIDLGSNKTSKIVYADWSVGGVTFDQFQSNNVKGFMNYEVNQATSSSQIGLMYGSDYGFAALPSNWTTKLNSYIASEGYDWMLVEGFPWTITSYTMSYNDSGVFIVGSDGGYMGGSSVTVQRAVLPAFYLSSNVKVTNAEPGVGTISNPMIIS